MTDPQDHTEYDVPPEPKDLWAFPARPDITSRYEYGVVDGDTYDVLLNQGFGSVRHLRVRPHHINTAEIFGAKKGSEEYNRGVEQRDFVRAWLAEHVGDLFESARDGTWPLRVRTYTETGKYGRWLADVYSADGDSLTVALIDEFGDEIKQEY